MARVARFLMGRLKLNVNEQKSRVAKISECTFLEFTFRGVKLRCSWGVPMEYRLDKLAEYVRGWMGYFGISGYYRPIPELDHWLRRRISMCYWKQWRYVRTKVRNLLACAQQQGLLAPVKDTGDAIGDDERVAETPRAE